MKTRIIYLILVLFILSCGKKNLPSPNIGGGTNPRNGSPSKDTSFISVSIGGVPMQVTKIQYNRSTGTFNFTAQNDVQKIDAYCFYFYGQTALNYQYSDSLNYSTRANVASNWTSVRAINWGTVDFDCCAWPLSDKVITGNFSGQFLIGEVQGTINGNFHLIF